MATPVAPARPADPTSAPAMCLLHADYHPMTPTCWETTVDFFLQHARLADAEARDCYQAAVEAAMLDQHIRRHLAGPRR